MPSGQPSPLGKRRSRRVRRIRSAGLSLIACAYRWGRAPSPAGVPAIPPRLPRETFSVAPMMQYTDAHFHALARLLTRRAALYTEMIPSSGVLATARSAEELESWYGRGDGWANASSPGPMLLQLGGNDEESLAAAAQRSLPWRYDAINLNCGCPSPKVAGKGCFGAALMRDAGLVARICEAMRDATAGTVPITVKCRLGVVDVPGDLEGDDDEATFAELAAFVHKVSEAGVRRFTIHGRKAVLSGLDPRRNRKAPPLKHHLVLRLARSFPQLSIILNGGVGGVAEAASLLEEHGSVLHGIMCGRAVINRPWDLATVDALVYGEEGSAAVSRRQVLTDYIAYGSVAEDRLRRQLRIIGDPEEDRRRKQVALRRRLLGITHNLFAGEPGGKRFRQALSEEEQAPQPPWDVMLADVFARLLRELPDAVLDTGPGQVGPDFFSSQEHFRLRDAARVAAA